MIAIQRPRFYEGQYLGSADLTSLVEYERRQQASHSLGGHMWGIAIGLQILERESAADPSQIQAFVQPGFAWDGFGRQIVANEPIGVSPGLFTAITYDPVLDDQTLSGSGEDGRLVPLWLQYVEATTRPPRPGFEVCTDEDQSSRIDESVVLVAGERTPQQQRDEVTLAGRQVDPEEALTAFDPLSGRVVDGSVPHQELPGPGTRANWLVPIGFVRWLPDQTPGQPGTFVKRTAADLQESRRRRRYVGLVAEGVLAADGILRLRDRSTDPSTVWSSELVGIEGDLRVDGDARLFGSRLEWRNADGLDGGVPMHMRRAGPALQIAIGSGTDGTNRLGVGPEETPGVVTERLVVRDDGRVGIGTTTPNLALDIRGDFGRTDGPSTIHLFGSEIGDVGGGVLFVRSGGSVIGFDGGDKVGIGTTVPRNPLGIRATGASEELISFEDADGNTTWHLNQSLSGRKGLNFAETSVEDGRLFIAAGGNVGIGTTQPALRLDVQGDLGRQNGPSTLSLFGSRIGDMGGGVLFVRSGGGVVALDGGDDIGIGTALPQSRLHVVGSQNADAAFLSSHVAVIDNINGGDSADVLALRIGRGVAEGGNNFITFFAGAAAIASVEGDGSGGVSFSSSSADFAEYLPRLDPAERLEPGDVVGIVAGKVTLATTGAHHVRVVSRNPIIAANAPPPGKREGYAAVAFLGQVSVKVRGPVEAGDLLIPSQAEDGTAVGLRRAVASRKQVASAIGTAWESSDRAGVTLIKTALGIPPVAWA
jgi:hypothetical protein